ncbi:MAG: hypothetical protein P1Q69_00530 [Candidatus Thorarchaeota archaeon]|nr:hypothetical protein [Candidatus Thorarchaeota archaeon]
MTSCEGCGASIDANDSVCPFCGRSIMKRVESHPEDGTYGVARGADGSTSVRFGDSKTGSRLPSGKDNVSSQYRRGAGSSGNLSGKLVEKLDQLNRKIEKGPDLSRQQGSKDAGVAMLDYFATIADLLSLYQDAIGRESHLDTSDHDRLSTKEERIRPKLKSIVAFCEKASSETKKKMGLSGSDIKKIKKAATETMRMTEYRMCARCGAMSKPGSKRCRECKASL